MAAGSRVPARSSCTDCGSWRWARGAVGLPFPPSLVGVWVRRPFLSAPLARLERRGTFLGELL